MPITPSDVSRAASRGAGVVIETPLLPSPSFSRLTGAEVLLKAENLQRTGSFKIRGAMNALGALSEDQRASGVVAASAGNHAQGVALAAAALGVSATVFMPEGAALPKVAATTRYGADVRLVGRSLAEADDAARNHAAATGAVVIHPYDDADIVAGQGTVGSELAGQSASIGTVVIPVGGGGLIAGSALALKSIRPAVRIVGVQSAAVPTYVEARRTGRLVELTPEHTVADGIAVTRPSQLCFELIERHVDDLLTVEDDAAMEAVALLLERAKLLVEPSGAVALAAILAGAVPAGDGPTVAVLSGGNIDLLLLDDVVRHGLARRGRFASISVRVPDLPGELAGVLTTIGTAGGNILSVVHHRAEMGVPLGQVDIHLTMETRSPSHFEEIVGALDAYDVRSLHSRGTSGSSP